MYVYTCICMYVRVCVRESVYIYIKALFRAP